MSLNLISCLRRVFVFVAFCCLRFEPPALLSLSECFSDELVGNYRLGVLSSIRKVLGELVPDWFFSSDILPFWVMLGKLTFYPLMSLPILPVSPNSPLWIFMPIID